MYLFFVTANVTMAITATIVIACTLDSLEAPMADAINAHTNCNAIAPRLRATATNTPFKTMSLLSFMVSFMASFTTNLSPHPGEVPVFS